MRTFRPFPVEAVQKALCNCEKAVVIDRNCSWGKGGIFADELKSAMLGCENAPKVFSYIAGLGGRSVTPDDIRHIVQEAMDQEIPETFSVWKGMKK